MRKRIVSGVVVSLAMVLAFTASAQAVTYYGDAISINLAEGADSFVSGTQAGAAGTNYGNWMNMTGFHGANWAAQADGGGWTSGSFDSNLTAGGTALTTFRIDLYDGGWFANSKWTDTANPVNTLGRVGMSNGDMPNNWGPTGLSIDMNNIPTAFATTGYEIWALGGATRNSGAGLAWTKISGADPLTTVDPASVTLNSLGWRSIAAVQVLQIGSAPVANPTLTAAPVDGTPIDFGHWAVSTPSSTTKITLSNTGDATSTIDVTSGAFGEASLFSFDPAFSTQTLTAGGAISSWDYFVKFNGSATAGIYNDTLTFLTSAGNLSYAVSATVDLPIHPGDANRDGTVDFLDYNIVKTNYLSDGVGWTGGDLNLDGTVDFLDYNIVKTHYLHTSATIGVQAIPEPATLALLALAGLAIRRKRQG